MGFLVDVFKVQIIDPTTNDVIATSLLQDAQIQRQLQSQDIRTGVGNGLYGVLYYNPATTIQLTHAEYAYPWLAKTLGQTIKTGAGTAWKFMDSYMVSGSSVTLPDAPTAISDVYVKNASGNSVTGFTLTGSTLSFSAATPAVADGDSLDITYQYSSDPETQTIEFDDSVFGKGVKMVLEQFEIDGSGTPQNTLQYIFDSVVPDGQFTLNTQSQRQAVTWQQTFTVVNLASAGSSVVGRVLKIPYTG